MKNTAKTVLFAGILLLLALVAFCGCSDFASRQDDGFGGGEELTPERIAEISRKIAQTSLNTDEATEPDTTFSTVTDEPGKVFWTENGTVYHSTRSCPALKNSENIIAGTKEQAIAADKREACSRCD